MKKLKVMTVVGTRPEIIRLSAIINLLNNSKSINHILVHTGQNYDYELNDIFFKNLNIQKPDYFLEAAESNAITTIGNIFIKIFPILTKEKPDAFLILGDTNSCLTAIAAKKMHIPIFHIEAGNRCFDQRVPEETNRKIVDHTADINLTYSNISRQYLISEGFPQDQVIKIGSPMFEVLNLHINDIKNSNILNKLSLHKNKYFLVSIHREENVNTSNFDKLIDSLNAISDIYKLPIIVSTHPRTRKILEQKKLHINNEIHFLKPMGFFDYNCLQLNSKAVLSDSGTISEESSILHFPALNLRESHERPEAMEEASVMMVGANKERILQGLSILESQKKDTLNTVKEYMVNNVSEKVIRIIISYTDYINQKVWHKSIN